MSSFKPYPKEKSFMTAEEYQNKGKPKKNKYNARKQTYNGKSYDSGLEADYARKLDLLIKAGEVKEWKGQYRFELKINNKVWRYYKIDFRVVNASGIIDYVEIKGFPTPEWKQKFDVLEITFDELTKGENARLLLNDKIITQSFKALAK